jgi:hypothetical protein
MKSRKKWKQSKKSKKRKNLNKFFLLGSKKVSDKADNNVYKNKDTNMTVSAVDGDFVQNAKGVWEWVPNLSVPGTYIRKETNPAVLDKPIEYENLIEDRFKKGDMFFVSPNPFGNNGIDGVNYYGNIKSDFFNPDKISEHFCAVINVSDTPCGSFKLQGKIPTFWVPIFESVAWGYSAMFMTIRVVQEYYKGDKPVLIHCHAGMNRSPTMAVLVMRAFGRDFTNVTQVLGAGNWGKVETNIRTKTIPEDSLKFLEYCIRFPKHSLEGVIGEYDRRFSKYICNDGDWDGYGWGHYHSGVVNGYSTWVEEDGKIVSKPILVPSTDEVVETKIVNETDTSKPLEGDQVPLVAGYKAGAENSGDGDNGIPDYEPRPYVPIEGGIMTKKVGGEPDEYVDPYDSEMPDMEDERRLFY